MESTVKKRVRHTAKKGGKEEEKKEKVQAKSQQVIIKGGPTICKRDTIKLYVIRKSDFNGNRLIID